MKTRRILASSGLFLSLLFTAIAAPKAATVVSVKGAVQASDGTNLQSGSALPVGAIIRTNSGSEVVLRLFDGTVASVQPDSELFVERLESDESDGKILKEVTVLNLQRGTVVASLDPAKKDITNFSVRTPRGVAVARGTVFAVRVSQDRENATVGTMSGTVTFLTEAGEITVAFGRVSSGNTAQTVAEAVAANPALASMFFDAAVSIARAVGEGSISNTEGSPQLVATVLAAVVQVAAQAQPNNTGQLIQAVVNASGAQGSRLTAVIAQAASPGAPGANSGEKGNSGNGGKILPALDQTQVVVSPSR